MANKETILLADDISDRSAKGRLRSRLIRDNATEFAKKLDCSIELFYVRNLNSSFFKKKDTRAFLDSFESIRESILKEFSKMNVPAKVKIQVGQPREEILKEIDFLEDPQMLILGTHGHKGVRKILLGSVAEEVIRSSRIPVFVLGPVAQEKKAVLKISPDMQILFLTDFSDSSLAAEEFVKTLCKKLGCSVLFLHNIGQQIMNIRQNLYGSGYIPFNMEKMFSQMTEDAQRELDRKTKAWAKQGFRATSILVEKEETLDKHFKKQIRAQTGLIVMGTHGRNKVVTSFLGSTARSILLESPLPVIVVRASHK
ncbi:universal stress protein [Bdellovibrio svalbardensis]|uniref:Universal stress protein n=1 Tax=Bdellovibrio svalbardensis TaxID=2972972 RepID=A0ABT6DMQ4_9BACT|nr:universal stress protein [Bdellovibrio svalbardensis]MDG0818152.1 universal stress protein [Bdellovibrio svalbardensis]